MRHAIDSRIRKLDAFFVRAAALGIEDEIRADLARYAAVLVAGFIERSVEVIVLDRLSHRAHPRVMKFITAWFRKGTNYDCEAITQLLDRFDLQWGDRFRAFLGNNSRYADSVTSIYTLRNSVAHGGDQNRGLAGVETLYVDCKEVVEGLVLATR
jgi:hypothetical protein